MTDVHAHFICWNEEETIRLTISHYQKYCSKIFVFDNFSTDSTPQICRDMGCEVSQFGIPGVLSDIEYTNLKNSCWKGSDADWVIVCDCDEILWDSDLKFILGQGHLNKATIFKTQGFNMVSNDVPRETWLDIQTGVKDNSYSKLVCFDPQAIEGINYVHGCHQANPTGNVLWAKFHPLALLHYRCVGGADRLINRHRLYAPRLSQANVQWKMGNYAYSLDESLCNEKRAEFQDLLSRSKTLRELTPYSF